MVLTIPVLLRGAEGNMEKPQLVQYVCGPRFESGTSRIWSNHDVQLLFEWKPCLRSSEQVKQAVDAARKSYEQPGKRNLALVWRLAEICDREREALWRRWAVNIARMTGVLTRAKFTPFHTYECRNRRRIWIENISLSENDGSSPFHLFLK